MTRRTGSSAGGALLLRVIAASAAATASAAIIHGNMRRRDAGRAATVAPWIGPLYAVDNDCRAEREIARRLEAIGRAL